MAKGRRVESRNEADNLMSVHKHRGLGNCLAIIPGISIGDVINDAGDVIIREEGGYLASVHTTQG